jgi:hypothetical protein
VQSLVPPDPPVGDAELIVRPSTERDVAAIRAVNSEPDIRYWMGWDGEALPDEAEARANIERAANAWREGIERASRPWPDGQRFDSILYSLLPGNIRQTGSGGGA